MSSVEESGDGGVKLAKITGHSAEAKSEAVEQPKPVAKPAAKPSAKAAPAKK